VSKSFCRTPPGLFWGFPSLTSVPSQLIANLFKTEASLPVALTSRGYGCSEIFCLHFPPHPSVFLSSFQLPPGQQYSLSASVLLMPGGIPAQKLEVALSPSSRSLLFALSTRIGLVPFPSPNQAPPDSRSPTFKTHCLFPTQHRIGRF